MSLKVKMATKLMNWLPNVPKYRMDHFQQEYFKHPEFFKLTEKERKIQTIRFIENDFIEGQNKPFDLYFPSIDMNLILKGKTVLDLGCSIGGKSIAWAERWKVNKMIGIDFNKQSIAAANYFIDQMRNESDILFKFISCSSSNLPFANGYFDAIITEDTIEHVDDILSTLKECHRVLRKGGYLFCVFPSYRFPFGGAHIHSATRTPFLEWFFKPETLNEAYGLITSQWNRSDQWFLETENNAKNKTLKIRGGIGTNCVRRIEFENILNQIGFSKTVFIPTPILSVGYTSIRHPNLRRMASWINPLLKNANLSDYLSHRLVYIAEV